MQNRSSEHGSGHKLDYSEKANTDISFHGDSIPIKKLLFLNQVALYNEYEELVEYTASLGRKGQKSLNISQIEGSGKESLNIFVTFVFCLLVRIELRMEMENNRERELQKHCQSDLEGTENIVHPTPQNIVPGEGIDEALKELGIC